MKDDGSRGKLGQGCREAARKENAPAENSTQRHTLGHGPFLAPRSPQGRLAISLITQVKLKCRCVHLRLLCRNPPLSTGSEQEFFLLSQNI